MIVDTIVLGPLQNNIYILADEKTREGIIIDATWFPERIAERTRDFKIKSIVITHGHVDHCAGAGRLKELVGGKIAIHRDDVFLYDIAADQAAMFGLHADRQPAPDELLKGGERIRFGEHELKVVHTPGHSPGGICLKLGDRVYTGDTLFARSIGRTDLWGGSLETLLASIQDRLMVMPDETLVYPGHGPATSIGEERKSNPFLVG